MMWECWESVGRRERFSHNQQDMDSTPKTSEQTGSTRLKSTNRDVGTLHTKVTVSYTRQADEPVISLVKINVGCIL
jgi:hypothetical protein